MSALTQNVVADIPRRVGRKRINAVDGDKMTARFPEGTLERMRLVLRDGEPQSAFIRDAVLEEIARREALPSGEDINTSEPEGGSSGG